MRIFKKKDRETKPHKELHIRREIKKAKAEESLWIRCSFCNEILYIREVERNLQVCPKCNYHFPVPVEKRISMLFDKNSFTELYGTIEPVDFLRFKDTKPYKERLLEAREATGRTDAIVCGRGRIEGIDVYAGVFDFKFMGGSLGSVVGEKVTRIIEEGRRDRVPVIIFCASGGARMQEGIISLMQMAKVVAAINGLKSSGIPYLTVLTDPTLGGVTASIGLLGDIVLAEPKAMIGFAGQRVIKETIKAELPQGFQRAEYLFERGMIDRIVERKEMKREIARILSVIL